MLPRWENVRLNPLLPGVRHRIISDFGAPLWSVEPWKKGLLEFTHLHGWAHVFPWGTQAPGLPEIIGASLRPVTECAGWGTLRLCLLSLLAVMRSY